jgi:hypothetical protein
MEPADSLQRTGHPAAGELDGRAPWLPGPGLNRR